MTPRISDSRRKKYERRPAEPTPGIGDANPLCPACSLRRAVTEFECNGWRYANCVNCRDRRPELKRQKAVHGEFPMPELTPETLDEGKRLFEAAQKEQASTGRTRITTLGLIVWLQDNTPALIEAAEDLARADHQHVVFSRQVGDAIGFPYETTDNEMLGRLRACIDEFGRIVHGAAMEVKRLGAENERLKAAIATQPHNWVGMGFVCGWQYPALSVRRSVRDCTTDNCIWVAVQEGRQFVKLLSQRRKKMKPVRAWAVVAANGQLAVDGDWEFPAIGRRRYDMTDHCSYNNGERIIQVEIRAVERKAVASWSAQLLKELDALRAELTEANAWIGEASNTPAGAIIRRLELELSGARAEIAQHQRLQPYTYCAVCEECLVAVGHREGCRLALTGDIDQPATITAQDANEVE